jgi:GT2 family glycosyltransferase
LLALLRSVEKQSVYPAQILIIDGSKDGATATVLQQHNFANLEYYQVRESERGLTRQRNFGIAKVKEDNDLVCFLDDDTILEPEYFKNLISTYALYPDALGVGGYIANEVEWFRCGSIPLTRDYYVYDQWMRKEPTRFKVRKKLGLDSNVQPGFMPEFSHGRSISFLPPSGKIYEVQQLMGGVSSFRKTVFDGIKFSEYFQGYGLYEDADFTLRLSKLGKLYVNTAARLGHFHDNSGRPDKYKYGKMVVRNGWYVWRVKYPDPAIGSKFKWHLITLLLAAIRFTNVFTTGKRLEALSETAGRLAGWCSLFVHKPKITYGQK